VKKFRSRTWLLTGKEYEPMQYDANSRQQDESDTSKTQEVKELIPRPEKKAQPEPG